MNSEERVENEEFEIAELEYDVGGVGAVEPSETQVNHAANIVICIMPMK